MKTSELFLHLLKNNPKETIQYFQKIALGDTTEVKFGFVPHSVSVTFLITGEPKKQNLCISKKLNLLFETSTDLEPLNEYLPGVKQIKKIHFCPYLKINEEPVMYAFQIGIDHIID
jgi:hypothetical protein